MLLGPEDKQNKKFQEWLRGLTGDIMSQNQESQVPFLLVDNEPGVLKSNRPFY